MIELDGSCDLWVTEIDDSERAAELAAGTAVDDDSADDGFLDLPERVLLGVARLQVELFVVVDPRKRRGYGTG